MSLMKGISQSYSDQNPSHRLWHESATGTTSNETKTKSWQPRRRVETQQVPDIFRTVWGSFINAAPRLRRQHQAQLIGDIMSSLWSHSANGAWCWDADNELSSGRRYCCYCGRHEVSCAIQNWKGRFVAVLYLDPKKRRSVRPWSIKSIVSTVEKKSFLLSVI